MWFAEELFSDLCEGWLMFYMCFLVVDACPSLKSQITNILCCQFIKRTLASLPCNAQSHSPSAYFDQSLFHFDEKVHKMSF